MDTKFYKIEGVGKVCLTRRKGSNRITMRVKPDGLVRVNYPLHATQNEVIGFIKKNADWIRTQQNKQENQIQKYALGQSILIRDTVIKIVGIEKGKLQAGIKGHEVILTVPSELNINSEHVQQFVYYIIVETCRLQAKLYLPNRVKQLAMENGFHFEKVFIKNLKSKWGSCSSQKNINLNLHLMRIPDHLIDYIILHELSHTCEMNHGPSFWALLNKVTNGKARELDKAMKVQSRLVQL